MKLFFFVFSTSVCRPIGREWYVYLYKHEQLPICRNSAVLSKWFPCVHGNYNNMSSWWKVVITDTKVWRYVKMTLGYFLKSAGEVIGLLGHHMSKVIWKWNWRATWLIQKSSCWYRPISSQPFSAGCHGNRNWRPIWKVAWWARVSCHRSRMYVKPVQFCPVIPYSTAFFFLDGSCLM